MNDFLGNCYSVSLELVGTMKHNAQVVHGWIYSTKLNKEIKHAWVEYDGKVWDYAGGRREVIPIADYYLHGKVRIGERYTKEEALLMARKTGRAEWWTKDQIHGILGF